LPVFRELRLMLYRFPILLFATALPAAGPAPRLPIEPVEIPPSIQQGVDLMYIDPEIAPALGKRDALLGELGVPDRLGSPVDLMVPVHPLYTDLRRGLTRYRSVWGKLPQVQIPAGETLKLGSTGERAALLRERLGLKAGDRVDEEVAAAVRRYQQAHGIKADGIAGAGTIASLNLGATHYERLVMINLERARRLPGSGEKGRYVLVDAGAARLHMYEGTKLKDSMKVIVGKLGSATPLMAGLIRYASVNPYWNVPTDLVQTLIAPKVLAQGLGHIEAERYQVLSDWTDEAQVVDPAGIDWAAVAEGKTELRMRQLPGRGNSMGDIKFMMPNDFGIYLHDTPDKALFERDQRWISNGCVRVEDARRLAAWLFGSMPRGKDPDAEEDVELADPVPVYITYLTVGASEQGLVFRNDPYARDPAVLARYFGAGSNSKLTAR
jgi:murein L,D-transpeptidase YcbB/YkuD